MSKITLAFMQRYQGKLNTAIKNYVKGKTAINKGTAIASGSDLNNMKTVGVYYITDDATAGNIANMPLNLCGKVLISDNGNNGISQIYMPNHSPRLFQRLWWENAWTSWFEYEKKAIKLTQVLVAGQTSVTFNSSEITSNSMLDVFTNPATPYQSFTGSVGTATVTFEAQNTDVTVALEIKEQ